MLSVEQRSSGHRTEIMCAQGIPARERGDVHSICANSRIDNELPTNFRKGPRFTTAPLASRLRIKSIPGDGASAKVAVTRNSRQRAVGS